MVHSARPPYRRTSRYGAIASCAPLALSLVVATPGAAHADPAAQHCAADALTPALARQRLEWARDCGVRVNVRSPSSPQPPSFSYDTGFLAADGVTHLIEYIETDDFWGMNSYSGIIASINDTCVNSQWRPGPITATTDVNGFQKWSEAPSFALGQPVYPSFGDGIDLASNSLLFPHPNYALRDCGFYANPTGTSPVNTSATGFFVNVYCPAASVVTGRCADGTQEQVFSGGMVGCAGAVSYADRSTLCAPGFRTVTAPEWVSLHGTTAPTHNYWTNDGLHFLGSGTSACAVSEESGFSCGATPMRVCTPAGSDGEGNVCNWQHCGLEVNSPDQYFGGCAGNTTAGALCIAAGCSDGSIEQTFAGGMVGCAGSESYANRTSICAPGYRVATASEWVALNGGAAPSHDYWTADALKYNGSGPGACFVSTTVGNDCGTTPMRVCTPGGSDAEGNVCNWQHCGIEANAPDEFFGGCVGNTTAGALCVPSTGCADGSVEQVFEKGMVGCAGAVAYASRDSLCAPGYQPATAAQWVANRGGSVPLHHYWTHDALNWLGSGPSACAVSPVNGNTSCGANPMRVCAANAADPEGNSCNFWSHCGLEVNSPDQWFGGCAGTTAGTLCTPVQDAAVIAQNTPVTLASRFAINELHASHGANTAGSQAAAAMMAAHGYDNRSLPMNWESALSAACTVQSGSTAWPAACKPTGMASALTAMTSGKWEARSWASTDQASALDEMVAAFQFYLSPVALPIFGQADHWVTISQITGTLSGSTWTISTVKFFDGGPAGAGDGGVNSYQAGLMTFSGTVWRSVYDRPVVSVATTDPYYNHYTMVFDPPGDRPHPAVSAAFVGAPGIVSSGASGGAGATATAAQSVMTAAIAQARVWDALTAAGINADLATWGAIHDGIPGEALAVHARWPSGAPWDYYLVPIYAPPGPRAHTAIAFVQLAASDGSFQSVEVLTTRQSFAPVSATRATRLARLRLARGERLAGATLTWDARIDRASAGARSRLARSPLEPYYELAVERTGAPGMPIGRVRVALDGRTVDRLGRASAPAPASASAR
jgi:hypothetical protein